MLYFQRFINIKIHSRISNTMTAWQSSQIFICGTARNCAAHLDAVFANINKLAGLFQDYRIIIAFDKASEESTDNSKDETLLKLKQHKQIHGGKMDVLVNRNPLSKHRTQNICNARNTYLNRIRDIALIEDYAAKYFIAFDMDDACAGKMDVEVFKRAMEREEKWDSVSFNRTGYYDAWALSVDEYVYSCWGWWSPYEVIDHMRNYIIDKLTNTPADEFVECHSAFSGFAVYKTALFLNCNYDWRMPKRYMKLEELQRQQKILWGVGSISPLEEQTDEPDCEHRAFHMMAIHENGARIRISPEKLFV